MKTKTLLTLIIVTMAIVTVSAQNKIVKQNIPVSDFSAISASGGWDIVISQGEHPSVTIEVSEDFLDKTIVEVKNNTLHISAKSRNIIFSLRNLRNTEKRIQKAYVTVMDLQKIEASGGVDISFATALETDEFKAQLSGGTDLRELTLNCNRFRGNFSGGCDAKIRFTAVKSLRIDASGGCDAELLDISAETARVSASGGCDLSLVGKTDDLTLNASGGCDVSAKDLIAQHAKVDFSGAADGNIHVTDHLDITVSSSADVVCYGKPKEIDKNVQRGGTLKFR